MNGRIETERFHWEDPGAILFFRRHGYVIIGGVLDAADRASVCEGWDEVVSTAARQVDMSPEAFARRFPQSRDLWRKSIHFDRLLFDTRQGAAASRLLGTSGVRLFHDHAIAKPSGGSGTIPWHQDSAYWPLDRVGASLWTPVADVGSDSGCLKVIDGSHLNGPCEPQDFLGKPSEFHDSDPRLVLLPVRSGETVALDGLAWHGSDPNRAAIDRLAYLTLWVPATARFVPEHAGWHPTAAHIGVKPGDRLAGEWFPLFGDVAEVDEGEPVAFPLPAKGSGPSMFTAAKDIVGQIAWVLDAEPAPLSQMLGGDGLDTLLRRCSVADLIAPGEVDALRCALSDLLLQERVRKESIARDVYLDIVSRWWALIGNRIVEARDGR